MNFLLRLDILQYRTFGYGHSFGVLSHFYGRESGLELREDIDTSFRRKHGYFNGTNDYDSRGKTWGRRIQRT